MTGNQKKELEKFRLQGYGYKKISNMIGLSVNTVKSYCRRHPPDITGCICLNCGRELENSGKRKKKFCSDRCRSAWWNSHSEGKGNVEYVCLNCGRAFYGYKSKKRKYCSRACYGNSKRGRREK